MVSTVKQSKNYRLCSQRSIACPRPHDAQMRQRRGSKAARRFYSAPPPKDESPKKVRKEVTAKSEIFGPQCTPLPLRKKDQYSSMRNAFSKIRISGKHSEGHGAPVPVRISFSLFTGMPNPPSTSPIDTGSVVFEDNYNEDVAKDAVDGVSALNEYHDTKQVDYFSCEKHVSKIPKKEEKLAKKQVSVLKFESNEAIKIDANRSSHNCHLESSIASLRPRSSVTPLVEKDSSNENSRLKSSKRRKKVGKSIRSNPITCETALKVQKYSYAELGSADSNNRPVQMPDRDTDACRSVFMLTHKSAQKYTLQLHDNEATTYGRCHRGNSSAARGIDTSVCSKSYRMETAATPLTNWEKKQLLENVVCRSKINTKSSIETAINYLTNTVSKIGNDLKRGFPDRTLGTIFNSDTDSRVDQTASRKSRNCPMSSKQLAFDHIIYDRDEAEIPKQHLLPQHRMKKELKLHVSDIFSTVESIKKVEKCRQLRLTELEKQVKALQSNEANDAKKRRVLREGQQDKHDTATLGKGLASKMFTKELNIYSFDDRLGKTPGDAAFIMRKREKKNVRVIATI